MCNVDDARREAGAKIGSNKYVENVLKMEQKHVENIYIEVRRKNGIQ